MGGERTTICLPPPPPPPPPPPGPRLDDTEVGLAIASLAMRPDGFPSVRFGGGALNPHAAGLSTPRDKRASMGMVKRLRGENGTPETAEVREQREEDQKCEQSVKVGTPSSRQKKKSSPELVGRRWERWGEETGER